MKKRDLILAAILILVFSLLFVLVQNGEKGTYITVKKDGKVLGNFVLTQKEQTINIGENNILTIINNEAYMCHAKCPDQICVNRGKVSLSGEEIICMPNRVIVRVEGGEHLEG